MTDQLFGYRLVQYVFEDKPAFYTSGDPVQVTLRIEQAIAKLEEHLGFRATYTTCWQGCHHDGAKSASTHLHADVFDLSYDRYQDKANFLMSIGVIPFVRPPGWDGGSGGEHIHCILRGREFKPGQPGLDPAAYAQISDWDAGRDGLAGNQTYSAGPHGPVKEFAYDPTWKRQDGKPPPPPKDPHFPDVETQEAAIAALHAHYWHVLEGVTTAAAEHPLVGPLKDAENLLTPMGPLITESRQGLTRWRKAQGG